MGTLISGIAGIGFVSSLHDIMLFTTLSQSRSLFTSCTILIAVQNILTTCLWFIHPFHILILLIALIVYRIWLIEQATFSGGKLNPHSPLRRVIQIIVESGMIYTTTILLCFWFLLTGSTAIYITSQAVCLPPFLVLWNIDVFTVGPHHWHHFQFNHHANAPHFVGIHSALHQW